MVGGITKNGGRVRAFETGKPVSIEELNSYCMYEKSKVKDIVYKSELTLKEAAAKYPKWHEKRIIKSQKEVGLEKRFV